jgi:hypothetical protein
MMENNRGELEKDLKEEREEGKDFGGEILLAIFFLNLPFLLHLLRLSK